MKRTGAPPLTSGYLGFDLATLADGELGPPIPTHALLAKLAVGSPGPANELTGSAKRYTQAIDAASQTPDHGKTVLAKAAAMLGPEWSRLYSLRLGSGADYSDAFGDVALVYWTQ